MFFFTNKDESSTEAHVLHAFNTKSLFICEVLEDFFEIPSFEKKLRSGFLQLLQKSRWSRPSPQLWRWHLVLNHDQGLWTEHVVPWEFGFGGSKQQRRDLEEILCSAKRKKRKKKWIKSSILLFFTNAQLKAILGAASDRDRYSESASSTF